MSAIPLLVLHPGGKNRVFFSFISSKIAFSFPGLKYDLQRAKVEMSAERYASLAMINGAFFGVLLGAPLFIAFHLGRGFPLAESASKAIGLGFGFMMLLVLLLLYYPRILAGKRAESIDNTLIFALKDLHLQVSAGVNLYHAMVNVSNAGYGEISAEITSVIRRVETGMPVEKSLEIMARDSKSAHLQKTLWQLINSMRAGASLKETLHSLIEDLKSEQYARIREYGQELNMMILMYLLFAIAIPSIGATLLIVLSGFGGGGISQASFISFGIISFCIQAVLITFIKSRRPAISL